MIADELSYIFVAFIIAQWIDLINKAIADTD